MSYLVEHPNQLSAVAAQILQQAADRRVFTLQGELGAGKTTFIQHLCRQLDVEDAVTSPTFSIVNEYRIGPSGDPVYHLDLYRLRHLEEALQIGIEEYLYSGYYCFVEWPELIETLLPEDTVRLSITPSGEYRRKILFL